MLGMPGRWCDEAILRALRNWTTELGQPPAREDWSGECSETASLAQRKWMREHPYWPSSSCVARHFGSWNEALRAAGVRDCAPDPHDGEPTTAPAWTVEAVRAAIRDWTDTYGRPPSYHEWTPSRT